MEEELDPLTKRIIGCAIALHRHVGPGLLESVHRTGLAIDMRFQEIRFEKEKSIDVTYRGFALGEFRPDFIVQNEVTET